MENERKQLTLGSLFDGIGGFPLAGIYAGIKPVWASEIEPFPIRVTEKRLPDVKHYGDVNKLNGGDLEPVDVVTFGSPCTALSVAGLRHGLHGTQSVLFFQAIRIIREMREKTNGQYPRWAVWENVPGALSSQNGRDFREVLESLIRIKEPEAAVPMPENGRWLPAGEILGDGYSLAWRVLDAAQGWGVAQRRKRVFAVLDLDGSCAGKVLFESEGVSGYTPPRTEARKGTARSTEEGAGETSYRTGAGEHDLSACLCASYGTKWNGNSGAYNGENFVLEPIVPNDQGSARMDVTEEETTALRAGHGGYAPCIVGASGFCTEHSADSRGIGYEAERSPTLRAGVVPGIAIQYNPTASRIKISEDGICQALCSRMGTGGNQVPLTMMEKKAYGIGSDQSHAMLSKNPHAGIYEAETSRTLDCNGGNACCNQGGMLVVESVAFAQNQQDELREPGGQSGTISASPGSQTACPTYCMTTGDFTQLDEEVAPPIMARDFKDPPVVGRDDPVYALDRACFTSGENAQYRMNISEEKAPTLVAEGPSAVAAPNTEYLVRRLTPGECCRLQGYPDGWCENLASTAPSNRETDRWEAIFEEYRMATGSSKKPKTRQQIIKWLQDPHTDSAEYKAYGNSVAVPCVFFVLAGIVWAAEQEIDEERRDAP